MQRLEGEWELELWALFTDHMEVSESMQIEPHAQSCPIKGMSRCESWLELPAHGSSGLSLRFAPSA